MKSFDFNIPLLSYAGEQFSQVEPNGTATKMYAGKVLATNLGALTRGVDKSDIFKIDDWARQLYAENEIMLDDADIEKLTGIINNLDGMGIVIKRQLLDILKGGREVKP